MWEGAVVNEAEYLRMNIKDHIQKLLQGARMYKEVKETKMQSKRMKDQQNRKVKGTKAMKVAEHRSTETIESAETSRCYDFFLFPSPCPHVLYAPSSF